MTIGVDLNSYRQMRTLVYEIIRDDIVNGDLSAGQRINLEQIAARLNVSRMPILEAIQRLEGEGFVCSRPHRGVLIVRPIGAVLPHPRGQSCSFDDWVFQPWSGAQCGRRHSSGFLGRFLSQ